jgi:hypothetical protein
MKYKYLLVNNSNFYMLRNEWPNMTQMTGQWSKYISFW